MRLSKWQWRWPAASMRPALRQPCEAGTDVNSIFKKSCELNARNRIAISFPLKKDFITNEGRNSDNGLHPDDAPSEEWV